jgi:IS66 Orf2 like protein
MENRNSSAGTSQADLIFFICDCPGLKSLLWDRDGYILWYKRLEAGVFKLPRLEPGARSVELRASELAMLLDGIDLSKLKRTPRYQHRPSVA